MHVEKLFVGGLGYCGSRIAEAIHDAYPSAIISGTVRSKERRDALMDGASRPSWLTGSAHVLDLDDKYAGLSSDGIADLQSSTVVVQTVAPIADFDRDPLLALHGDALESSEALQYVAYLSSTGVYGDYGGDWVAEESELRCVDAKSKARVVAEQEWCKLEPANDDDSSAGPRVDCFRCGGIYGPGRGPLFSSISSLNAALDAETEEVPRQAPAVTKYVNRILVDDICGAILAAIEGDRPRCGGRAYNLVDDDPAPRKEVVVEARRLLSPSSSEDIHGQSTASVSTSDAATKNTRRRISRATGNKRCDNGRLKEGYGWSLKAPTYREGLALLLETSDLKL